MYTNESMQLHEHGYICQHQRCAGPHHCVVARPQVVDISVGTSVPTISNFRALPTPGNAIWPQFLLDIDYQGAHVNTLTALQSVDPNACTVATSSDNSAYGSGDRGLIAQARSVKLR